MNCEGCKFKMACEKFISGKGKKVYPCTSCKYLLKAILCKHCINCNAGHMDERCHFEKRGK